jgi:hypothetical protein
VEIYGHGWPWGASNLARLAAEHDETCLPGSGVFTGRQPDARVSSHNTRTRAEATGGRP